MEIIDAIFVKEKAKIYLVEGQTYAGVDYMNMCSNPSSFAKAFKFGDTAHLQTRNRIDAITTNRYNCLGQRVELFQIFRTNRTVTCDQSSYGLNTISVINCAPNL